MNKKTPTNSDSTPVKREGQIRPAPGLALKRMPREFRKNIWAELDRPFLITLFVSLIFHVAVIYYLFIHLPEPAEPGLISDTQKKYADLLLGEDFIEAFPIEESTFTPEDVTTPAQWYDIISGFGVESLLEAPTPGFEVETDETAVPTAETVVSGARAAAEAREGTRVARAERAREIGLMQVIMSGGSGSVDMASMNNMLAASDEDVGELGDILARLDGLKTPSQTSIGFRTGKIIVTPGDFKGVRASRPEEDIARLVENVEPLASVEEIPIERNETFERVHATLPTKPNPSELV